MTNCSLRFCSEYPDLLCEQQMIIWAGETAGDYQVKFSSISIPEDDGSFIVEIKLTPVNEPLAKREENEEC